MRQGHLTVTQYFVRWSASKRVSSDGKRKRQGQLAVLPQMRRQNTNSDTDAHGVGGFPSVLPQVQIFLCDSFQERKN